MSRKPYNKDQHCTEVLTAIRRYWAICHNSPTVREIGQSVGIKHPSQIKFYLDALEEQKKIIRTEQRTRNIFLPEIENNRPKHASPIKVQVVDQNIADIPNFGSIIAGVPFHLPDASHKKTLALSVIQIPESYLPAGVKASDVFALRVEGDSMRDAMLTDGDIVILQTTSVEQVKDGDIVAAWILDTQETTLKRFYRTKRGISLRPENPEYDTLYFQSNEVEVQGKLLAVLRFRY